MFVRQTIELRPNNKQKTYFRQCFGARRLAYNYGLAEWIRRRDNGEKTNCRAIRDQFNAIKMERYPFLARISRASTCYAFDDLKRAFDNFFHDHDKIGAGNNAQLSGFPQPKSKTYNEGSYTEYFNKVGKGGVKILDPAAKRPHLKLPCMKQPVRMTRPLRYQGRPVSVTIRQRNERFHACFLVEVTEQEFYRTHKRYTPGHAVGAVGIDLGTKELAVTSDGISIQNPHHWERQLQHENRLQLRMNRCTGKRANASPGKNFLKAKHRLWKLRTKIRNQREDYRNKLCAALLATYQHIAIETLDTKMMGDTMNTRKGRKTMRKRLTDVSLYQIRHRLETLGELLQRDIVAAPKDFCSTRTCSQCGHVQPPLSINQRTYHCPKCGNTIDRDLNAAVNLLNLIGRGASDSMPRAADRLRSELIRSNIPHSRIGEGKKAGTRS